LLMKESPEGMAVSGQILQMLMERAGIADAAELAERMREAGNTETSEEEILALMYGDLSTSSPVSFVYADTVLGATSEEWDVLMSAFVESFFTPKTRAWRPLWELNRAMKRREHFVLVEELTEEEADSEQTLWWVSRDVGNAAYYLKRRWVFGDEADELVEELEAIHERVQQLGRGVPQHHQQLFRETVPLDECEEE
jgi:hypothetical protein